MREFNFVPVHEIRPITLNSLVRIKNSNKKSCYTFKEEISINKQAKLKVSVKSRREFCDYDYLHKLNDKQLKFMEKFNREYLNADFKTKGKRLHRTKKLLKNCFDMNNSRNRDLYGLMRTGQLIFLNMKGYP